MIAAIAVAIETHGSSAASRGRAQSAVSRVAVPKAPTPGLKRLLEAEISHLRAAQPTAPRTTSRAHAPSITVIPEQGVTCFVATGSSRCSENPCREFASAPTVYRLDTIETIRPQASRKLAAPRNLAAPACPRQAPRKPVLVSGP